MRDGFGNWWDSGVEMKDESDLIAVDVRIMCRIYAGLNARDKQNVG